MPSNVLQREIPEKWAMLVGNQQIIYINGGVSPWESCFFPRPNYKAKGILEQDPFVTLDIDGVGELILLAVERGRKARSGMKMGICGECLG